jgi:hypothetical protein
MNIQDDDYSVTYQADSQQVVFGGTLRLGGTEEYTPLAGLLQQALDTQPEILTLNLRNLAFVNSSGINMLSKFVIKVRQQGHTKLVVLGSAEVPWQTKSLKNLQRLLPTLVLRVE